MNELSSLWEKHCQAQWPESLGSHEGELMTLDTVIGGCVRHFLIENRLDAQRIDILKSCKDDLEAILIELSGEGLNYFTRLHVLACLLLKGYPLKVDSC